MPKVASIESGHESRRLTPELHGELSQSVHDQQGSGTSVSIGEEEK